MAAQQRAGARVKADLAAALARAARELGRPLEWSEAEAQAIDAAVRAADQAQVLREMFAAELADQARPAVAVKLSAELRLLDKAVVDLVARVNPGVGPAKSERHVRAARSRWDAKREGA